MHIQKHFNIFDSFMILTLRLTTIYRESKMFYNTIAGFIIPGICLVATGYVDCNAPLAIFLIVVAVGVSGISMAGWGVNHLDLAPPYAGKYNFSIFKFTDNK